MTCKKKQIKNGHLKSENTEKHLQFIYNNVTDSDSFFLSRNISVRVLTSNPIANDGRTSVSSARPSPDSRVRCTVWAILLAAAARNNEHADRATTYATDRTPIKTYTHAVAGSKIFARPANEEV